MMLAALFVYGSHARGDAELGSDVDLLGLNEDEKSASKSYVNRVNLTVYSPHYLVRQAEMGDLFLLHIAKEAKALIDPFNWLDKIRDRFKIRASYDDDIYRATQLGRYICQFIHRFSNTTSLNRRIAWVVRTILIAKSVNEGRVMFSGRELVDHYSDQFIAQALSEKDDVDILPQKIRLLSSFLDEYGAAMPIYPQDIPGIGLIQHQLMASGNTYAAKAIADLEDIVPDEDFYSSFNSN